MSADTRASVRHLAEARQDLSQNRYFFYPPAGVNFAAPPAGHEPAGFRSSGPQATRRIAPQLLSEDQSPRSSRKRSIGAELRSERMRQRPTPVHWKPHFSKMR